MTERKAPAADDSAAIQRTADRIIRQVGDLLLRHGELSAWAVHKPPGSDWVDAPAEQKIGKWFHFGCYGGGYYFVWPHSIDWESNPVRLFDGICQSLTAILSRQSPRLPDELADWMRGDPTDAMARWVWFASGYATTPLRDAPRTRRKCWGNDGASYFDADRLEFQRSSLPEILRGRMPPNADCWLVEIKNLLQTTIDAVEYLAELSYEAPSPVVANTTNSTAATNSNEQTEAVAAPADAVNGDNRKATGKAGGRPRKARRTPEESKVMNYRKANSKAGFCDIDDELELERGESQRIYEAVTRRERRKKSESADKTGRN